MVAIENPRICSSDDWSQFDLAIFVLFHTAKAYWLLSSPIWSKDTFKILDQVRSTRVSVSHKIKLQRLPLLYLPCCNSRSTFVCVATAGTFRFCSSYDLGNQCQYVNFLDFDRPYRACVLTCSTGDGCNAASFAQLNCVLLVAALAFALRSACRVLS